MLTRRGLFRLVVAALGARQLPALLPAAPDAVAQLG